MTIRLLAYMLVALVVLFLVGLVMSYQPTSDLPSFLYAAERVTDRDLYGTVPDGLHRYFYSPWFAVMLIPLTWLPFSVAAVLWHTLLALALAYSLWWMVAEGGYAAAALVGAFGFHAVWSGHPQPLMIALLVATLPTRWGPVGIGIAASLKIVPLILVVRYAGRGEWGSVAVSLAVAGVLWAPALLYDLSLWGQVPASTLSLFSVSPLLWGVVAVGCLVIVYRLAPTRYGWLAASVAWMACMPRLLLYDVSALAVARTPRP